MRPMTDNKNNAVSDGFLDRLQCLIDSLGVTQKKLGEKAKVDSGTISRWKSKTQKTPPSTESILKIATAWDCSFEWLLTGKGEMFAYKPPPGDQIDFNFGSKKPPEETESRVDLSHEKESFSMKEMVSMTMDILESDTVYRSALASNIRAFHKSVTMEEEVESVKKQLEGMNDRMQRMEELLLSLGATLPEKREASNS